MKNNLIALSLSLVVLFPAIAYAEGWKQIDQNSLGDTISIDTDSIKQNGEIIRYTEQIVFVKPRPIKNGLQLKIMKSTYAVNCANRTSAPLNYNGRTSDGQLVSLASFDMENPKFASMSNDPKSPDAITFEYFCIKQK
jgi:hypothetical protein